MTRPAAAQTVTLPAEVIATFKPAPHPRTHFTPARTLDAGLAKVMTRAMAGKPVKVLDLADAVVASLIANSTRYGQSMDRRYGYAPLVAVWTWLRDTHPHALVHLHDRDPAARPVPVQTVEVVRTVEVPGPVRVETITRPDPTDAAVLAYALDMLTPEQRARVAGYRDGLDHAALRDRIVSR